MNVVKDKFDCLQIQSKIETFSDKRGKPGLRILGKSRIIIKKILKNKKYKIFLSLSDEKTHAVAFVVITL